MTNHDKAIDHTRQALANLAHGNIEEAQVQLEKALQAAYAIRIKGEKP